MHLSMFLTPLLVATFGQAARLVDFQVAQPPPLPNDAKQCTVQILEYLPFFSPSTAPLTFLPDEPSRSLLASELSPDHALKRAIDHSIAQR